VSIEDDDPITWEDGPLKISDFCKEPPKKSILIDGEHIENAESVIMINPVVVKTSTDKTESGHVFKFEEVGITTLFMRKKSWIYDLDSMSDNQKEETLIHEQGHFDMTQIFCLKARKEVAENIVDKTFPVYSKTESEMNQEKQMIVNEQIYSVVEKFRKLLKIEQKEYEDETLHGIRTEVQAKKTANFNLVLRN